MAAMIQYALHIVHTSPHGLERRPNIAQARRTDSYHGHSYRPYIATWLRAPLGYRPGTTNWLIWSPRIPSIRCRMAAIAARISTEHSQLAHTRAMGFADGEAIVSLVERFQTMRMTQRSAWKCAQTRLSH